MAKQAAGELWSHLDFVFTTRYGTPIEPRNFNRRFMDRSALSGVRRIRLHGTRHIAAVRHAKAPAGRSRPGL
ncbi:hypothetical protein PV726_22735 [Streptomyces europaeiscabiei]|uniref:hypothetical protein n=1 Tax=Streptomyces europaeiscabiei TaxID=146819 RepID=UPI0029AD4EA9|nr:hypothetical protein [Streptomyces europaeiscabiei]MDX3693111.1 hypothetical protein [Streptomyces europaeiscabiei]